jgi:guanylate kinase
MSNDLSRLSTHGPGCDRSVLLVLSAPSGTGKTTLARRLVETIPEATFSISATTRQPRGSEKDGVDYWFVTEARFREMVQQDLFAEWAEVHDHFYGTPRTVVENALETGRLALFDIDVQGGEQLKSRYPSALTVLVLPPSYAELERRLRARGTDSDAVISRRLLAAQAEVRRAKTYDYCLVNDDLDRAFADLKAIVTAERARCRRYDFPHLGF